MNGADANRLPRLTGQMPSVCMECGDTYAVKPCVPEMDGLPSHGYCPARRASRP